MIGEDRSKIQNEIRHRLNQSQQSCGFMDDDCMQYLAELVHSGAARHSDVKAVGGPEVAWCIHITRCVIADKERELKSSSPSFLENVRDA